MICCTICKKDKEEHLFYKAHSTKNGFLKRCIECYLSNQRNAYDKLKKTLTVEEFKLKRRKKQLKSCYGLSLEEYDKRLEKQNFKCAICETHEKDAPKGLLFVDHCHKTEKVRGLLCHRCNTALGHVRDSIPVLSKCISYLEENR
jgi:hypothetical protein